MQVRKIHVQTQKHMESNLKAYHFVKHAVMTLNFLMYVSSHLIRYKHQT